MTTAGPRRATGRAGPEPERAGSRATPGAGRAGRGYGPKAKREIATASVWAVNSTSVALPLRFTSTAL